MPKGWIYKITYRNAKDGINRFPIMCYVGQTRNNTVKDRFTQHKRDARNFVFKSTGKEGNSAKLHEAMRVAGIENFGVEILEEFSYKDEAQLVSELNSAESKYISKFDSINLGWNKVAAPQSARTTQSTDFNLAKAARDNDVHPNSLRHRINEMGETIEEAIRHLKNLATEPTIIYEYKRQHFSNIKEISESKIHNRHEVSRKTLEIRIRKLKEQKLFQEIDDEKNKIIYKLPESIFKKVKDKNISVTTPDGEVVTGTKKALHDRLKGRFPDQVPQVYQTLVARLGKKNWTAEQAFGFEYPPDLIDVKPLIEEGYDWVPGKPDFTRQDSKPVILHSKREVFVSQKAFSEAYGLANDLVSDHIVSGKTAEEILEYYKLKP